jgi:hypothetical protein
LARNHLRRKLETYQALACINIHFESISRHILDLEQMGFFPGRKMRVFQGLTRELQSQISHDVCDRMHEMEDQDMFEFGKVRVEWEHHLNPHRPGFTIAQPVTEQPPNGRAAVPA